MKPFRHHITQQCFLLIIGLVFLNLSFIMIEIQIMELAKNDRALYESIIRLVSSGFEEEKDVAGECGCEIETESTFIAQVTEILLLRNKLKISGLNGSHQNGAWNRINLEIFLPPPRA